MVRVLYDAILHKRSFGYVPSTSFSRSSSTCGIALILIEFGSFGRNGIVTHAGVSVHDSSNRIVLTSTCSNARLHVKGPSDGCGHIVIKSMEPA